MNTRETKLILAAIEELSREVRELKQNTMEMKKLVEDFVGQKEVPSNKTIVQTPAMTAQQYFSDFNVNIPISTIEDFDAFDEKLKRDKIFMDHVISHLRSLIDEEDTLIRNITHIMKFFFVKDVVLLFTAVRKTEDKKVFKEALFCDCLESAVLKKNPNEHIFDSRKRYYKALGSVFINAKDWAGGRSVRRKRSDFITQLQQYEIIDDEMISANDQMFFKEEPIEPIDID